MTQTYQWANNLQRAVMVEWLEGIERDSSPEAQRKLRLMIGKKYSITVGMVEGIVHLMATEGLKRMNLLRRGRGKAEGKTFELIDYHELVKGLTDRVEALERRFRHVVEGIEKVLEDGQTFAIHLQQLQTVGKRVGLGRFNPLTAPDAPRPLSIEGGDPDDGIPLEESGKRFKMVKGKE